MNNIVLTSCEIRNDNFKKDFYNIVSKEELSNKKVLYITTAVDGEKEDTSYEFTNDRHTITVITDLDREKIYDDFFNKLVEKGKEFVKKIGRIQSEKNY